MLLSNIPKDKYESQSLIPMMFLLISKYRRNLKMFEYLQIVNL